MMSLRTRLILGSSLIAVIPLAVALGYLSAHVRGIVRGQAEARLAETLADLEARLRTDLTALGTRLAIAAREPELRRRLLVGGDPGALVAHLDERRTLLGLDYLRLELAEAAGDTSVLATPRSARGTSDLQLGGHRDTLPGLALVDAGGSTRVVLWSQAPVEYQGERVAVLRGGLAIDSAFLARARAGSGVELLLRDANGATVAATLPIARVRWRSAERRATSVPVEDAGPALAEVDGQAHWARAAAFTIGGPPHPEVIGLASTAAAERTIGALQAVALGLAAAGVALAVALGLWWSRGISRPVERLAADAGRLARGDWSAPIDVRAPGELQALVESLERMRIDLVDYRARLVASERHAAWSRMARAVAHEIKNPLTPIAIAVADLRRSYEKGHPEFPQILAQAARTVGEEVDRLQRILQEFARLGRFPEPVPAAVSLDAEFASLRALYTADVESGRLAFAPAAGLTAWADAGKRRQALVNLIQNALDAAARGGGRVEVSAVAGGDGVAITVADDGPGLDDEQRARVFEPGFTTKPEGGGLGLTIVERIVLDHGGAIDVESAPGRGTAFTMRLPRAPRS